MPRVDRKTVLLPTSIVDAVDSVAEAMDVTTSALLYAALTGLVRSGQMEAFAERGSQADPEVAGALEKRRPRHGARRWVKEAGPGMRERGDGSARVVPTGPAVWRWGRWTMRYVGSHRVAKMRRPGEGWHLFGPGLSPEGKPLAFIREEAVDIADRHIDRHERQLDRVVGQ